MAFENPKIDLIYKPKPKHLDRFLKLIERVSADEKLKLLNQQNITIDSTLDPQLLMINADVVVGINSTTILEAALAGKPVVVPYFKELKNSNADQAVRFKDAFHTLDVASNASEFAQLVKQRAKERVTIPNTTMRERRRYFEKYISDPNMNALDQTTKGINAVIDSAIDEIKPSLQTSPANRNKNR